ncbi:hypothetical protein [Streptomyces niveus]|uniref:hypothetical protein n=1 Tax=Streptomyces niveus TaxID=193462 RepID=UPI00344863D2
MTLAVHVDIEPTRRLLILEDRPTGDASYAPLPTGVDIVHARIVKTSEIGAGDLILAVADAMWKRIDYFPDAYPAEAPDPFVPHACDCYECEYASTVYKAGDAVVITRGFPWDECDVWGRDVLALIVRAEYLPDAA